MQDEMRRRHFQATQKLRLLKQTDLEEDKARLEHEILTCGSGRKKNSLMFGRNLAEISFRTSKFKKEIRFT